MTLWNGSGTNTIITVIQGVDELSGGLFGVTLLLLLFGIGYVGTSGGTRERMVVGLFLSCISATFLSLMGALSEWYLMATIIGLLGAIGMLVWRD